MTPIGTFQPNLFQNSPQMQMNGPNFLPNPGREYSLPTLPSSVIPPSTIPPHMIGNVPANNIQKVNNFNRFY
jgi:hypothetical protein